MAKSELFSDYLNIVLCLCFVMLMGASVYYNERRIIALENEVESLRTFVINNFQHGSDNDYNANSPIPTSNIQSVTMIREARIKRHLSASNEEISGEDRNVESTPTPGNPTEVNIIRHNLIPSVKPLVKSLYLRSHQDQSSEFDTQRPRHRQRHRQKMVETFDEPQFTVLKPTRKHVPAAHFIGDSSKYIQGQHANFNGNGHMRHLSKTYVDWQPSDWVESLHMNQYFSMNNGILTVKEPGLYLVYAQIYYLDKHDLNGYMIYKNGHSIMQCTTMTHSTEPVMKSNTCHTAGVEHFLEGDTLHVQDLSDGRYSLFEKEKSFFGVVKLSDTRMK